MKLLNQWNEALTLPLGFQQHVYWKMMSRKRRRVIILGMWIFTTSLIICEVYFFLKKQDLTRLISPASWWIPLNVLQFPTILLKKLGSSASSWHSWGLKIDLRRRFLLKLVEKNHWQRWGRELRSILNHKLWKGLGTSSYFWLTMTNNNKVCQLHQFIKKGTYLVDSLKP